MDGMLLINLTVKERVLLVWLHSPDPQGSPCANIQEKPYSDYLLEATESQMGIVYIYGSRFRTIVPLIVSYSGKA